MLKASALHIVLVIALVIAIFSASLIATAYYYRLEYQKNQRYSRLQTNLSSAAAIVLSESFPNDGQEQLLDLYGDQADSIALSKDRWGLFDLAAVKAFTLNDTLKKTFLVARETTKDLTAIYLSDEDRPLSVSGSTQITGVAELPKAGIKQAYVDGKPYAGKDLVNGKITHSTRTLPPLEQDVLDQTEKLLNDTSGNGVALSDSLDHSFFNPAQIIRIDRNHPQIANTTISGKVIILCDTILTIGPQAHLEDVLIYARAIVVKEGFRGSCQLFARDSVSVAPNTIFEYPSAIGIIKKEGGEVQPKVVLGSGCKFSGILFTYENKRSELQTLISLGKDCFVKGEIYSAGFIKMEKPVTVEGKVLCNRFIIQTPSTLYENYLIDITINRNRRSPYYLSSALFNRKPRNQVLKWLQ